MSKKKAVVTKKDPIGKKTEKTRTTIHMDSVTKGQLKEMAAITKFSQTYLIKKAINDLWGDYLTEK